MITLPKSKAFWAIASSLIGISGVITHDRYECGRSKTRFDAIAREHGSNPANSNAGQVTVIAFGKDTNDLREVKAKWRHHAVGLLTKAGCDYNMVEVNAAALDKQLGSAGKVSDGPASESFPQVITPLNWIAPAIRGDKVNDELGALWNEKRPTLKLSAEGIIVLDSLAYESLKELDNIPIYYIPCDPAGSFLERVRQFITQSWTLNEIGNATLEFIQQQE